MTGVIAIMNIGAAEEESFTRAQKKEFFGQKLLGDIRWMIANGADIIMLQEVSEHWAVFLSGSLPKDWILWRAESCKVATMYNERAAPAVSTAVLNVWPEEDRANVYRGWRKFSVVRTSSATRAPLAPGRKNTRPGGPHPF